MQSVTQSLTCSFCRKPFVSDHVREVDGKPVCGSWCEVLAIRERDRDTTPAAGSFESRHREASKGA